MNTLMTNLFTAPAKTNPYLAIGPKRNDGYHTVATLMQPLRCHDTLRVCVEASHPSSITFSTEDKTLQHHTDDNLIVRAARLWLDATHHPAIDVHIHLTKTLPMQAGMGGGSSDAATTLLALNRHAHTPTLPEHQLIPLAHQLGADVAFFLTEHTLGWGDQRGDVITPLPNNLPSWPVLIIQPNDVRISTVDAYQWWAQHASTQPTEPLNDFTTRTLAHRETLMCLLSQPTPPTITQWETLIHNDFETVLLNRFDVFQQIIEGMHQLGVGRPFLSGSGSAMVGILPANFCNNMPEQFSTSNVVNSMITTLFPASQFTSIVTSL